LTTVAYQLGAAAPVTYALEGSVAVGGLIIGWLRDNLSFADSSAAVAALADTASTGDTGGGGGGGGDANGGVFFVPAFSGLYAPYWRADARGAIVGLTQHSTKAHIARAAIEAVAYQVEDVRAAMRKDLAATTEDDDVQGVADAPMLVDGGMCANDTLLQFQADISRCRVRRPRSVESTAFGAAVAAGIGAGFWKDTADVAACVKRGDDAAAAGGAAGVNSAARDFTPAMAATTRERLLRRWHMAIERSLGWEAEPDELTKPKRSRL
jgi:glycerol kinase